MCGICGIYDPRSSSEPDQNLLDRATDLMTHRGPDDRGTWSDHGIGLGHRRLAVIDPEGSPQPMHSTDGRYVISYNGEVYNFAELRRELEGEGIEFRTKGDTEVVLEALAKWGVEALQRFSGMFALALWDKKERSILLARDRLGIKPLFYSETEGKLIFASEFRSIFAWPWISREPDPFGVASYLSNYQLSFDGQSIFRDIKSLESGYYLKFDGEDIQVKRYWELPIIPAHEKKHNWPNDRLKEAAHELTLHLKEAVESHLVADVPVGAFLSGGIDSSVVIKLMSEMSTERVKAYSIGFDYEGFSEFEYSVPLVKELELQHKLLELDHKEYFPHMEELIKHKLAPLTTPNEVPLWVLSRHLSKDIKVVLSGEGADELLGGYAPLLRSPHDYLSAKLLRENPGSLHADLRRAIRTGIRRQYGQSSFRSLLEHFLKIYSWVDESDRKEVLSPDFYNDQIEDQRRQVWRDRLERCRDLSVYDRYLYILETEHLRGLLMRLDADTMAASVEGRVPFCDNRLVEFVWQLPFDFKLRYKSDKHRQLSLGRNSLEVAEKLDIPKYLLKTAFKDRLPEQIINRKKKAFPVPLETWMNGEYKDAVLDRLTSNSSLETYLNISKLKDWAERTLETGTGAMKVWMLLSLVIWLEHIDS